MNKAVLSAVVLLSLLAERPVHAYIDPSTGGILAQLLAGGAAGLLVLGRLYWGRIKRVFSRRGKSPDSGR